MGEHIEQQGAERPRPARERSESDDKPLADAGLSLLSGTVSRSTEGWDHAEPRRGLFGRA